MLTALVENPIIRIFVSVLLFGIFITIIISVLPVIPFDGEMESAFEWLFTNLWKMDWLLPIGTMVACLLIVISAEFSMLMISFYLWLKSNIKS